MEAILSELSKVQMRLDRLADSLQMDQTLRFQTNKMLLFYARGMVANGKTISDYFAEVVRFVPLYLPGFAMDEHFTTNMYLFFELETNIAYHIDEIKEIHRARILYRVTKRYREIVEPDSGCTSEEDDVRHLEPMADPIEHLVANEAFEEEPRARFEQLNLNDEADDDDDAIDVVEVDYDADDEQE
ncbi:unnamed protein product [Caenorhabditis bovis]|uniref:Uncharacterized protein n=1 Tax=Caenorhabditis bovis TaxID=2654633 RepID=A0A8S1ELJ5_9PELO|nr:unnamed protein product [Caenorhabditis bovis]